MTAHEWGVLQLTATPTDVADIVMKPSTTTGPAKTTAEGGESIRSSQPSLERGTFNEGQSTIMPYRGLGWRRIDAKSQFQFQGNRGRGIDRERVDIPAGRQPSGIGWLN